MLIYFHLYGYIFQKIKENTNHIFCSINFIFFLQYAHMYTQNFWFSTLFVYQIPAKKLI